MALKPFKGHFTLEHASLLARRSMFGATPGEIRLLQQMGVDAAVSQLLSFNEKERQDNPFKPEVEEKPGRAIRVLQLRWLYEMLHSPFPFREKLSLFWHNHFVVGTPKVRSFEALQTYINIFRSYGLSTFEALALESSKTPAMLRYLDNDKNKKGKPNENFAREFLELFTLGIGNYSEQDVLEAARAFTGWTYQKTEKPLRFVFRKGQHDNGQKTFLGETGNFEGKDIVRIATQHEATARFISRKLWLGFISDSVDETNLQNLSDSFMDSKGNLSHIMREILSSEVFYKSTHTMIKSPVDYVIGSLRSLGMTRQTDEIYNLIYRLLNALGQLPLAPPHVAGWAGGRNWISDNALLAKIQAAQHLILNRKLFPEGAAIRDLSIALLGNETTALNEPIKDLALRDQLFLILVSPEYALS